ncbi:MAG: NUDIX hydrolase [Kiritimatiellales bacterium]|nr:NUDIX hydrolase [Kiritimatiellota bacterium]MBL7012120.1 NUDIX hydrolase [Kiritimatiellales bacterium]
MSKTIEWARRIAALAQAGLTYTKDPYEKERCEELQALAAEMMAAATEQAEPASNHLSTHRKTLCPSRLATSNHWKKIFQNESGYATPKVDVRGAIFQDGKVLLSREQDDDCWSLPGGWADVNDTPSEAVIREVREETGYPVRCTKLAAVLDRDLHYKEPGHAHPFHIYKLLFLCELTGDAGELCHDITDAAFFDLDDLPPLSKHRTLPKHIELLHKHHQNPGLPTDFD